MSVDVELLDQKVQLALKRLQALEKLTITEDVLRYDIGESAKVYGLYQNLIERCVGITTYILKAQNELVPNSVKETFAKAAQLGIINDTTAHRLQGAYGFRNIIVHDYDSIDIQALVQNHQQNLANLRQFLKEVASAINSGE